MKEQSNTVEIRGLTKIFGQQRAVDNVSFDVGKGQILGFLGPNGAGKSTTMKMITSYLRPDAGSVNIMGMDAWEQSLETRKRIGYLPEHNPLYFEMYVTEYLNFVAEIHRIKDIMKRVEEIIEQVGLTEERHKLIGSLSKGYKQRVGLAQALIHDPEILILDEPTSGLDMNQLQGIRQLIKELGKTKTILFSTHIMQEVQALCDRVVIINQGKIVGNDSIEILAAKIKGEGQLVIEVVNPGNIALDWTSIDGVNRFEKVKDKFHIFHDAGVDVRPAVFDYCTKKNLPIIEMKRIEVNVEDVFQKLTRG